MTSGWLITIIILSSIQSCLLYHPAFLVGKKKKNQQHAPFSIDHITTTPFWIAIGCHTVTQPKPLKLIDEKKANWKLWKWKTQFPPNPPRTAVAVLGSLSFMHCY